MQGLPDYMGLYVTGPFFLVTEAIFTVILLQNIQNKRRSLQFNVTMLITGWLLRSHYPDSVVHSSPVMSGFLKIVPSPGNVTQCLLDGVVCAEFSASHTEGPGCWELTSGVTHPRHPDTRRHPDSEHPTRGYYHHIC